MPIANCVISNQLWESRNVTADPVTLWAARSSQDSNHMTINISVARAQYGNAYSVVANLLVPASWSAEGLASLQSGLSSALETYLSVSSGEIIICTSVISSGHVFEGGQLLRW